MLASFKAVGLLYLLKKIAKLALVIAAIVAVFLAVIMFCEPAQAAVVKSSPGAQALKAVVWIWLGGAVAFVLALALARNPYT